MNFRNYEINGEKISFQDINRIAKSANGVYENKCITAILFEKPIIFSKENAENYGIDFWHMGSLENKDLKKNSKINNYYNIKPCNNTTYSNKCANCIEHNFPINIRNKMRDKCVYRMSSIDIFHQVIDKANNMEDDIQIWKVENYSARRTKEINLKIRYQKGNIDYLIILNEKGEEYFFITAYPVFEHREKNDLTKEYNSKNSIKIK
jgi:hypothetical protein